jgi:hypothetical protein
MQYLRPDIHAVTRTFHRDNAAAWPCTALQDDHGGSCLLQRYSGCQSADTGTNDYYRCIGAA